MNGRGELTMIDGITVYNFYIEMVVALAFFVFRIPRRSMFVCRLVGTLAVLCGLCYLLLFTVPEFNVIWDITRYILLFAAFVAGILFCWKVDIGQALFCGIAGYGVQHVICKLNVVLRLLISMFSGKDLVWMYYIITPILYVLIWLLWGRKAKNSSTSFHFTMKTQAGLAIALLICTTVVSQVFDFEFSGGSLNIYLAFVALDIIFAVFILIVQFNLYIFAEMRHDMAEVERIHHFETQQLEQTKEMIDLINVKSHDLKHQLLRLQGGIDESEATELLKTISLYDSTVKTENEALNVVLMRKNLTISGEGVSFTPIIDASSLGFMKDGDIYSLFGNLIDNALEAVQKLPEGRRSVTLVVKNIPGFVSVHIENEFAGELKFKGGLPQTSKADKTIHGFGMKSISMLVKKYKGTLSIDTADNVFSVDILLPHNEKQSN